MIKTFQIKGRSVLAIGFQILFLFLNGETINKERTVIFY